MTAPITGILPGCERALQGGVGGSGVDSGNAEPAPRPRYHRPCTPLSLGSGLYLGSLHLENHSPDYRAEPVRTQSLVAHGVLVNCTDVREHIGWPRGAVQGPGTALG